VGVKMKKEKIYLVMYFGTSKSNSCGIGSPPIEDKVIAGRKFITTTKKISHHNEDDLKTIEQYIETETGLVNIFIINWKRMKLKNVQ
jgi:hypothetical protein